MASMNPLNPFDNVVKLVNDLTTIQGKIPDNDDIYNAARKWAQELNYCDLDKIVSDGIKTNSHNSVFTPFKVYFAGLIDVLNVRTNAITDGNMKHN